MGVQPDGQPNNEIKLSLQQYFLPFIPKHDLTYIFFGYVKWHVQLQIINLESIYTNRTKP